MNAQKVLLVTGGSRGIGAATAQLAAQHGWQVGVNYRTQLKAAQQVVATIEASGGQALALAGDVNNENDVARIFDTLQSHFGSITGLVNNAGILAEQKRLDEMDISRVKQIINTNIMGTFLCSQQAVKRMSNRYGGAGGTIVNVSSRAAVLGAPDEYIDYALSKGAIDTLTVGLAREVANEGIRVNGVRPGLINTEIHASGGEPGRVERLAHNIPMKRGGTAQEVAQAILWLLSPQSSYVTGSIIDVSGGR